MTEDIFETINHTSLEALGFRWSDGGFVDGGDIDDFKLYNIKVRIYQSNEAVCVSVGGKPINIIKLEDLKTLLIGKSIK